MATEEEQITKIVDQIGKPEFVQESSLKFGDDSTGDPAVFIMFTVSDEVVEKPAFFEETTKLEESIIELLHQSSIKRWPYFWYRSVSDKLEQQSQ